ncbi:hypothetical protein NDU88_006133 [Pleurodeles waltl]|uniref:Uncharacterized protein n=1 Tax=Pleurodeles waltl TaxID=8319 RepID=A0AAV7TW98_PLEWA|nr:hypothetical protein NDU88_006133 [Pleurodeles waltl]
MTRSSSPGSLYDSWVSGIKEEDARHDGGEPRRMDSSNTAKARSVNSGGNEDKRSKDSGDHAEGRREESWNGEARVRGGEDQASGGQSAPTPSHIPRGTWLNKVRSSSATNPWEKKKVKTCYPKREK